MSKNITVGIGGILGHDGNAALLMDGRLVSSSQEERFTRIKHDAAFPVHAIRDCLQRGGVSPKDVSTCVLAEKPVQVILQERTQGSSSMLWRILGRVLLS